MWIVNCIILTAYLVFVSSAAAMRANLSNLISHFLCFYGHKSNSPMCPLFGRASANKLNLSHTRKFALIHQQCTCMPVRGSIRWVYAYTRCRVIHFSLAYGWIHMLMRAISDWKISIQILIWIRASVMIEASGLWIVVHLLKYLLCKHSFFCNFCLSFYLFSSPIWIPSWIQIAQESVWSWWHLPTYFLCCIERSTTYTFDKQFRILGNFHTPWGKLVGCPALRSDPQKLQGF